MEEKKEIKLQKTQNFKVLQNFTYDKAYKKGQNIELSDKTTISTLLTNKLIK